MVTTKGAKPSVSFRRIVREVEQNTADDMGDAGVYGRDKMREYISTRATQWGREVMGREGRIETGKMIGAVGYRDGKYGPSRRRLEIGWISEKQDYFRYQETGFNNKRTGRWVEGMYAMQDAVEDAMRFLERRFRSQRMRKK